MVCVKKVIWSRDEVRLISPFLGIDGFLKLKILLKKPPPKENGGVFSGQSNTLLSNSLILIFPTSIAPFSFNFSTHSAEKGET